MLNTYDDNSITIVLYEVEADDEALAEPIAENKSRARVF